MQPGQLAGPIEIPGGYSILYLIDKRQVLTADPRDAVLSLKQISLTFPKGTTEKDAAAKAAVFASTVKTIHGCGEVAAAASWAPRSSPTTRSRHATCRPPCRTRCSSSRSAKSPRRSARSRTACAC
jgi:hypothetical protein